MAWRRGRRVAGVGLTAALAIVAAGCEPPPPPLALQVTTDAGGADHTPGDGVCEATPGEGDCTLPAAIDEANTAPTATITVPAGEYRDMDLTVTGDVGLNWGAPADVRLADVTVTVVAGARLRAAGLLATASTESTAQVRMTVAGALQLDRSFLVDIASDLGGRALTVLAGGGVVVTNSTLFGGVHAVDNAGSAVIDRSTLLNFFSGRINTTGAGQSYLRASLLSRAVNTSTITSSCSGTAAISLGATYYAPFPYGCTVADSDVAELFTPLVTGALTAPGYGLGPGSPAVDAIPLGDPMCSPGSVDLMGNPRGVDGNGDGTPGCDIGAVERQP